MRYVFLPCLFFFIQTVSAESVPLFRTVVLDEQFFSEGADFGDFDGDGIDDIAVYQAKKAG